MKLIEAIAIFDKSASRTTPNAQTEAWAVIRAELDRVAGSALGCVTYYEQGEWRVEKEDMSHFTTLRGQRVRLVVEAP